MDVKHLVRSSVQTRRARRWFVRRASVQDQTLRASLATSFEKIEVQVKCEHFPREMLTMVDYILAAAPPGPLVECGCYLGGSSAKEAEGSTRMMRICPIHSRSRILPIARNARHLRLLAKPTRYMYWAKIVQGRRLTARI